MNNLENKKRECVKIVNGIAGNCLEENGAEFLIDSIIEILLSSDDTPIQFERSEPVLYEQTNGIHQHRSAIIQTVKFNDKVLTEMAYIAIASTNEGCAKRADHLTNILNINAKLFSKIKS